MHRGEDQLDRSGDYRRFELLCIRQIIDRHHHPASGQDGERRHDPDRRVGRPNRDSAVAADPGVLQPMGQAQRLVAYGRAVPARNILFREGDHTRVQPARREVVQQTDDVPTFDQATLTVATATNVRPLLCRETKDRHRQIQSEKPPFGSRLITSYGLAVISTKTRRLVPPLKRGSNTPFGRSHADLHRRHRYRLGYLVARQSANRFEGAFRPEARSAYFFYYIKEKGRSAALGRGGNRSSLRPRQDAGDKKIRAARLPSGHCLEPVAEPQWRGNLSFVLRAFVGRGVRELTARV